MSYECVYTRDGIYRVVSAFKYGFHSTRTISRSQSLSTFSFPMFKPSSTGFPREIRAERSLVASAAAAAAAAAAASKERDG